MRLPLTYVKPTPNSNCENFLSLNLLFLYVFCSFIHWTFEGYIFLYSPGRLCTKPSVWLYLSSDFFSTTLVCLSKWARHKNAVACRFAWSFKKVGFHYICFVYNSDEKWWFQLQVAAQGLGLRPHPKKKKKKIPLWKKTPRVKSPNFYRIIYIYIF